MVHEPLLLLRVNVITELKRWKNNLIPFALILAGAIMRLVSLDHLPGLNGDESWYGVLARSLSAGETSSFRTPNLGLAGPVHLGLVFIFDYIGHIIGISNAVILRMPSVFCGFLAVILFYYFIKKYISQPLALWMSALLMVFPMPVLYSRFGWEISQISVGLLLYFFALFSQKWIWAIFAFILCISIHPISLFLLPIWLVMVSSSVYSSTHLPARRKGLSYVLIALTCGFIYKFYFDIFPVAGKPLAIGGISRLFSPVEFYHFALNFCRLFSGLISIEYITGELQGMPSIILFTITALVLTWSFYNAFKLGNIQKNKTWQTFLLGLYLSILAFYIKLGSSALVPGHERYGYIFIIPCLL